MENKNEYAIMLNSVTSQFKKLSELEKDKKYKVEFFETMSGNYGEQLIANIDGFKISLPARYNKLNSKIDKINTNPPHMIYKGKKLENNKEKHEIEFI